jgi:spore coat polysaccharide biosynthesis protein SpsF
MIGDRPMLQWVVDQLRHCKDLDDIVLATVAEAENRPLQDFAEKNGMPCFWYQGEVEHVTTRLRRAAEAFDADVCVLVSGDCPLIHAPAIDQLIRSLKDSPDADTVGLLPDSHGHPPALQGIVASRKKAWQLADNLADRPELKEHQFPVIGLRPDLFQPVEVVLPECHIHAASPVVCGHAGGPGIHECAVR